MMNPALLVLESQGIFLQNISACQHITILSAYQHYSISLFNSMYLLLGLHFVGLPSLHGHSPQSRLILPIASTVTLSLGSIGFFFPRLPKVGTQIYHLHPNPGLVLDQENELEFDS